MLNLQPPVKQACRTPLARAHDEQEQLSNSNPIHAPNMQTYASPNTGAGAGGAPSFYSTSGQQQTGVPNPDDLQLTAQLSRGLEPIMNASSGGNMSDSQDPRGPSQGTVNHQYDGSLSHSGAMQSVHSPMGQMGGDYGTPDVSMTPRKRSKVSRACDECRRKKIRCDATNESDDVQCSNCKRVGTNCQFSRVPMKRGPSKGYIKELADRLNSLESAVHSGDVPINFLGHQESPTQRRPSEEFSPPPSAENKKRTFSSVSGDFGALLPQPSRNPPPWSPDSGRNLPNPALPYAPPSQSPYSIFKEPVYSSNGMQASQEWRAPPEPRPPTASTEVTREFISDQPLDWDDTIIDGYYQHIHPTYSLLQHDKSKLRARLDSAPLAERKAFYEALHAAVRPFPASIHHHAEHQNTRKVAQIPVSAQSEKPLRSKSTDLLYLQTLLLVAIATNCDPSIILRTQYKFPRSSLAEAVDRAYHMKLHLYTPKPPGDDPDSDDKVARRLWLALVSMDRWHAAATGRPALIPENVVAIFPEDQKTVGETSYQITRISIILEHASRILVARPNLPPLGSNPDPLYGTLLRGEVERLRESLPSSVLPSSQSPIFHLCYWHMRILVELSLEDASPTSMADAALNLVTQINHLKGVFSPLIHYCLALVALTLLELLEYEKTRDEADRALKSLLDTRMTHSSWDAAVRELITNRLQQRSSASLGMSSSTAESNQHASVASQGLKRLELLATAAEEGRDITGGEDRKEGEKTAISVSAPTPLLTRSLHAYFGNLRRVVSNGFLYAFETGESAR